ncbi:MAG TPA: aspartate 1-decarboxylase [Thermoanaerobaculia bacterium]|nr:aspartate 1-decarboxylase [Thermoanaerobaculia bacterium]
MIRRFVRAVIHNATVTHAGAAWPVSLRLDPILLRSADVQPYEEVEIVNVATGSRWSSWVEPAAEGSGEVHVQSGSDHHVRKGEVITIVSYGLLHDGQTLAHKAKVLTLDGANRVVTLTEE